MIGRMCELDRVQRQLQKLDKPVAETANQQLGKETI